jgi:hypothetical protein
MISIFIRCFADLQSPTRLEAHLKAPPLEKCLHNGDSYTICLHFPFTFSYPHIYHTLLPYLPKSKR